MDPLHHIPSLTALPWPESIPLSFAQQRMWFVCQLVPDSAAYNSPGTVHLRRPVERKALAGAVSRLALRHAILRTTFQQREGVPEQVPDSSPPIQVPLLDLTSLPALLREQETHRLLTAEARRCFDLRRGPLLRVHLLRRGAADHILAFTFHHIISDGWSIGIFLRELMFFYNSFERSGPALSDLKIQYADYALWQRRWMTAEILQPLMSFWRRQLMGAPSLRLPADRTRPAVPSYRGESQTVTFPPHLSNGIRFLCRREKMTLFMVLVAAFFVLLRYLTGQQDICIGTDVANRTSADTEHLIGLFVNQLVLRAAVSPALKFKDFLNQVRDTTIRAYAHQDVPFERIVEDLNPERSPAAHPLFQAKIVLQNHAGNFPGGPSHSTAIDAGTARLDLTIDARENGPEIVCRFEYNCDLFDKPRIVRWTKYYEILLRTAAAAPQITVVALMKALDASDRRDLMAKRTEVFRTAKPLQMQQ